VWSIEETRLELEFEGGTVNTGRVDFSADPLTLILQSFGAEWDHRRFPQLKVSPGTSAPTSSEDSGTDDHGSGRKKLHGFGSGICVPAPAGGAR